MAKVKFPKTIAVTVDPNASGPTDENLLAWKDVSAADSGRVAIYTLLDEVDTKTVTKVRKQGEREWFGSVNPKNKFSVGMRVRPTPDCPIRDKTRRATVVRFSRDGKCVGIRFDAIKYVVMFHPDYWEEDVAETDQGQTVSG